MKKCKECGRELPLSEFYKYPRAADGHAWRCKDCKRRYNQAHREQHNENQKRRLRAADRRALNESQMQHRKLHPERGWAQLTVQRAIRSGAMVRPATCVICGGSKKLVAHHHDYSKPLDVTFICHICHSLVHDIAEDFAARVVAERSIA